MVKGHRKDVEGLDCHPTYEGVFATCSESERIFLWDARAHLQLSEGMLKTGGVTRTASKLAFRPDGARLAVGTHEGAVFVFRSDEAALKTVLVPLRRGPTTRARLPLHDCVQKIAELKYSPDSPHARRRVPRPVHRPVRRRGRFLQAAVPLPRPLRHRLAHRLVGRLQGDHVAMRLGPPKPPHTPHPPHR